MRSHIRKIGCFLALSVIVSAVPEFARTKRGGHQPVKVRSEFVPRGAATDSVDSSRQASNAEPAGKIIMVLQTREYRITVMGGEKELRYSVATDQGIALAEKLTVSDLKGRYPDLHDIITGIAWAGL
jgi:hypothetical protein